MPALYLPIVCWTTAVIASGDELSNGAACCFLHGDAFGVGAFAECCLFAISEAERHGHATMVSVRYHV